MALIVDYPVQMLGQTVILKNAYVRIDRIEGRKTGAAACLAVCDERREVITTPRFDFSIAPDGECWLKQGYAFLKTLPEFEGATDDWTVRESTDPIPPKPDEERLRAAARDDVEAEARRRGALVTADEKGDRDELLRFRGQQDFHRSGGRPPLSAAEDASLKGLTEKIEYLDRVRAREAELIRGLGARSAEDLTAFKAEDQPWPTPVGHA
jgi:hypothetical protein